MHDIAQMLVHSKEAQNIAKITAQMRWLTKKTGKCCERKTTRMHYPVLVHCEEPKICKKNAQKSARMHDPMPRSTKIPSKNCLISGGEL